MTKEIYLIIRPKIWRNRDILHVVHRDFMPSFAGHDFYVIIFISQFMFHGLPPLWIYHSFRCMPSMSLFISQFMFHDLTPLYIYHSFRCMPSLSLFISQFMFHDLKPLCIYHSLRTMLGTPHLMRSLTYTSHSRMCVSPSTTCICVFPIPPCAIHWWCEASWHTIRMSLASHISDRLAKVSSLGAL